MGAQQTQYSGFQESELWPLQGSPCRVPWDKAHEISHCIYNTIGSSQRSELVNVKLVILFKTITLISYEQVSTENTVLVRNENVYQILFSLML